MSKRKTYPEEVQESELLEQDDAVKAVLDELVEIAQESGDYDSEAISDEDLACAKKLTGSAELYDFSQEVVDRLSRFGIAAKLDDGSLMRGFMWFQYFK
jgi:hypothetical protein